MFVDEQLPMSQLVSPSLPGATSAELPSLYRFTVAVIGLGYVGLPLAATFGTPRTCLRTGTPL